VEMEYASPENHAQLAELIVVHVQGVVMEFAEANQENPAPHARKIAEYVLIHAEIEFAD